MNGPVWAVFGWAVEGSDRDGVATRSVHHDHDHGAVLSDRATECTHDRTTRSANVVGWLVGSDREAVGVLQFFLRTTLDLVVAGGGTDDALHGSLDRGVGLFGPVHGVLLSTG